MRAARAWTENVPKPTRETDPPLASVPWIASANLIAGRKVIPEFCFRREETWDEIRDTARALYADGTAREACLAGIEEVRQRLGAPGASDRVARWILNFLKT